MGKDRKEKKERRDKKSKRDRKDKSRKRKRERYSSSDDSSGSSSDEEAQRRREASKMAKRVEKHLKKHGGSAAAGFGYTDEDNPFGDARLSERFVWGKKIEKQLASGADVRDLTAKAEAKRAADRMAEIEKVQARREQREAEREAMAAELEAVARERAAVEAVELERKEEEFHLEQAKVRARQRLAAGRPKAIDLITNNLFLLDGFDPEEQDPAGVVAGLNLWQLRELSKDVEEYAELDARDPSHLPFWRALAAVVEHDLAEATKQEAIDRARVRGVPPPPQCTAREAGWHESLDADVAGMLAGKRHSELSELEHSIRDQLDSGEAADPEYWGAVLRRLTVYKARAFLREFHADVMQRHLDRVMAGADVPKALVGGRQRAEQARAEAARAAEEQEREEAAAAAERAEAARAEAEETAAVAAAAQDNAEEIELPEEEEEEEEGGAGGEDAAAAAAPAAPAAPSAEDLELEALAAVDIRMDKKRREGEAFAAAAAAAAAAAQDAARGEPRAWDDLDDEERELATAAAAGGDLSPRPLPPEHVVGADVAHEDEDARLMGLLRAQVRAKASARFREAAAAAAASGAAVGTTAGNADRLYRQMVANPRAAGPLLGATAPLLQNLVAAPSSAQETSKPEDVQFRAAAARAMGDLGTSGDAPFGGEVAVDSQVYWWHEKYRPRKPKYFNRVHTGYDWNKYNKTHYDADNPPPKTVQGYKFNIFYPDLIDPTKAPTYKVEPDPSSEDGSTCLVRFSAGPPYEDIAFRIVTKDWELNPKRGFKCVFDRGILHLYFNFKRQFYRR